MKIKPYNLPRKEGLFGTHIVLHRETEKKNYNEVKKTVRLMPLEVIEDIVTALIYGQITDKIIVVSKEEQP